MKVTYQAEAGKGSRQRPVEVSTETYQSNWDVIFGDKNKKPGLVRCKVCHGEGGAFDCGYWYECPVCSKGEK